MKMQFSSAQQFVGACKAIILFCSFISLSACGESKDVPVRAASGLEDAVKAGEILPYYIVFDANGVPNVRGVDVDGEGARIVDVKSEEFPIQAKIKKVQTITMVTYEGSCEVLFPTPPTGYKKVIITNPAVCAKILP
jgi:hypothetical protein